MIILNAIPNIDDHDGIILLKKVVLPNILNIVHVLRIMLKIETIDTAAFLLGLPASPIMIIYRIVSLIFLLVFSWPTLNRNVALAIGKF